MGGRRWPAARLRRRACAGLVAVTLVAAGAACGGDDGGGGGRDDAADRTSTTATTVALTDGTIAGDAETAELETTERTVENGDVSIHVETTGAGDAADADDVVVAIHGGPGLGLTAADPFRRLATAERVVVLYDQRGAGASTPPGNGDFGLDAQVGDLEAVRAALGAERIHVIGESFGGVIASAYAAAHPDRVASLVLVSAIPLDRAAMEAGTARLSARIAELQAEGLIPATLPPNEGDSCLPPFDALAPAYVADPENAAHLDVDVGSCSSATAAVTQQQIVESPRLAEAAEELAGYTGPALAVMGEHDPFGLELLDRSVELLASADVERVVMPDVGHRITIEAPDVLFERIERILD